MIVSHYCIRYNKGQISVELRQIDPTELSCKLQALGEQEQEPTALLWVSERSPPLCRFTDSVTQLRQGWEYSGTAAAPPRGQSGGRQSAVCSLRSLL